MGEEGSQREGRVDGEWGRRLQFKGRRIKSQERNREIGAVNFILNSVIK